MLRDRGHWANRPDVCRGCRACLCRGRAAAWPSGLLNRAGCYQLLLMYAPRHCNSESACFAAALPGGAVPAGCQFHDMRRFLLRGI